MDTGDWHTPSIKACGKRGLRPEQPPLGYNLPHPGAHSQDGMEVTSTWDFVSRVQGINKMIIPMEDIDLAEIDEQMDRLEVETLREIDEHLENQEKNAKEVYEQFDSHMFKRTVLSEDNNLPEGWNMKYNMNNTFSKDQV